MKKTLLIALTALLTLTAAPTIKAETAPGRGGCIGAIVGCCFGIRSAAAYNEGKSLDIREWLRVIPVAGVVAAVWNSIEGWNGVTTSDLREKVGAEYY